MAVSRNVWVIAAAGLIASVVVALAAVVSTPAWSAKSADASTGDQWFAKALPKLLAGEGDSSAGVSVVGNKVTVPLLTTEQIKTAVSGNTVRTNSGFALYFSPDGGYEGIDWDHVESERSKCPQVEDGHGEGPGWSVDDEICYLVKVTEELRGTWSASNGMLCAKPQVSKNASPFSQKDACVRVALMLNRFVPIQSDGRVIGTGRDLVSGKVLQMSYH